jgi:hypothetical protein
MFASERETFIEREKENVGEKKQEKKEEKNTIFIGECYTVTH